MSDPDIPEKQLLTTSGTLISGKPGKLSFILLLNIGEGQLGLAMNSFMLQPGEDQTIAGQLAKMLRAHSA